MSHEGNEEIVVRRDDFVKGQQNPWQEVFSSFSAQIRGHIGAETHDLILPQFSTTDPVSKAVSEIVLMEAMKSYFRYGCHTMCGIPEITLEGSPEDWRMIREKAEQLAQFDLEWWIPSLLPIWCDMTYEMDGEAVCTQINLQTLSHNHQIGQHVHCVATQSYM